MNRHTPTPTHQWARRLILCLSVWFCMCNLCPVTTLSLLRGPSDPFFFVFFSPTRSLLKQSVANHFSSMLCFSPAAPVPFRRTEETAGARHGPHHPTSEQLVSHFRVYMQSISRVCNLRLSKFLMIGINATTPPLFSSYTHALMQAPTHITQNSPHLDQSIWGDMAWSDFQINSLTQPKHRHYN